MTKSKNFQVSVNPTNKNIAIFRLAMMVNSSLGGIPVISCKSGKDRTAMAITYEEGRIIRETCGVSAEQVRCGLNKHS